MKNDVSEESFRDIMRYTEYINEKEQVENYST